MTDIFEELFEGEPLGETPAAFDLSELSVGQAMLALQMAMAREGGNRSQTITDVQIGPDTYTLRANVGFAEFIQERHDMGPQYALSVVQSGRWTVKLLADVVFQAMVEGGTDPRTAKTVVDRWVKGRPWGESVPLAQIILQTGVVGVVDEPPGKTQGAAATTDLPTSPEAKSDSPPSTDTPPLPE